MKYIKKFNTHAEYEAYIASEDKVLPNVSICVDTPNEVHYNPYVEPVETRVVAKFNVTDTSNPTKICNQTNGFSEIEIDGVAQPSVVSAYAFNITGEHTVKYTLKNPINIDYQAFKGCNKLTSIVIPDSVTIIGNQVFTDCTSLTSCTIDSSATYIGQNVFSGCTSLTSIEIPNSVTQLSESAFTNCTSITSCTIGSGVTTISRDTFRGCTSLTSITIPDSVTIISSRAFQDCSGLTSITSNATTAPTITSNTFQSVGYNGTLTVPSGSSGYDTWMQNANDYLGKYNWAKVEQ